MFDEAVHADLLVFGGEKGGEVESLDLEAGVEIDVESGVDGLLGRPQRVGGPARNRAANRVAAVYTSASGTTSSTSPIRSASAASTNRPVKMRSLARAGPMSGQPLGATGPGDDSEQDLRLPELRAFAAYPEIGAQREFEAAAERVSGDRATTGLGILAMAVKAACRRWVTPACRIGLVRHLLDVGAGREHLRAAVDDCRPELRDCADLGGGLTQLALDLGVKGVHRGPVEADGCQPSATVTFTNSPMGLLIAFNCAVTS